MTSPFRNPDLGTDRPQVLTAAFAGRPLVVKRATGPRSEQDLRSELDRLQRAAHLGVVTVVATVEVPTFGFATAWAGGHTLASAPPPASQLPALLAQVCATVADLHDRGLVHGHLTLDHVVLTSAGQPTLCGFGSGDGGSRPPDDVAAFGQLVHRATSRGTPGIVAEGVLPDRRWGWRESPDDLATRALQTLADHATDEDPNRRPTARVLARMLTDLAGPAATHPERSSARAVKRDARRFRMGTEHVRRIVVGVGTAAALGAICALAALGATGIVRTAPASATPGDLAMTAVRSFVLLAAAYLTATAALLAVGTATHSATVVRWGQLASGAGARPAARRLAGAAVGAVLSLVPTLPRLAALGPGPAPSSAAAEAPVEAPAEAPGQAAIEPEPITDTGTSLGAAAEVQAQEASTLIAPANADRWIARRGDHLWGIAETTVTERLGRTPTDDEVARYWRRVIATNADVDDPDLIHPGQVIELPPS